MNFLLVLALAQFAAVYPLLLWQTPVDRLPAGFTRFNLGLATVVLGIASLLAAVTGIPWPLLRLLIILAVVNLSLQFLTWHSPSKARALLTPVLLVWGLSLWQPTLSAAHMMSPWVYWTALAMGGLSFGAVLYAMILGHWYLNVTDLPIRFLQAATRTALIVLALRLIWTLGTLLTAETVVQQRLKPAYHLLLELDGIFLWIGLVPGLLGALAITAMALQSARIQSTQSATGLLYVALVLVTMSTLSLSGYLVLKDLPL